MQVTVPTALGLIETNSVARGMVTVDALVKKAPVEVHSAHPISPGNFIVIFSGGVAEVEESLAEGLRIAADHAIGHVFLPQVHPMVPRAIDRDQPQAAEEHWALAVVETYTVSGTIVAADAACKTSNVQLIQMRLGQGLGGKAFFVLSGELDAVESAVEGSVDTVSKDWIQLVEIVARPHPDFLSIYR